MVHARDHIHVITPLRDDRLALLLAGGSSSLTSASTFASAFNLDDDPLMLVLCPCRIPTSSLPYPQEWMYETLLRWNMEAMRGQISENSKSV